MIHTQIRRKNTRYLEVSKEQSETRDEKICRLYQEGKTQFELKKIFSLSESTISAILKSNLITTRGFSQAGRLATGSMDKIDWLYIHKNYYMKNNIPMSTIANMFNISEQTVNRYFIKNNLYKKSLSEASIIIKNCVICNKRGISLICGKSFCSKHYRRIHYIIHNKIETIIKV